MRTGPERTGHPDRTLTGRARRRGSPRAPECCETNPRRGHPDRTRAGPARSQTQPVAVSGRDHNETVVFSSAESYTYQHNRGTFPAASVRLANGAEVETEVVHVDENTVTLSYYGTITDGVLVLS